MTITTGMKILTEHKSRSTLVKVNTNRKSLFLHFLVNVTGQISRDGIKGISIYILSMYEVIFFTLTVD